MERQRSHGLCKPCVEWQCASCALIDTVWTLCAYWHSVDVITAVCRLTQCGRDHSHVQIDTVWTWSQPCADWHSVNVITAVCRFTQCGRDHSRVQIDTVWTWSQPNSNSDYAITGNAATHSNVATRSNGQEPCPVLAPYAFEHIDFAFNTTAALQPRCMQCQCEGMLNISQTNLPTTSLPTATA